METSTDWVVSNINSFIETSLSDKYTSNTSHSSKNKTLKLSVKYYLQQLFSIPDEELVKAWKKISYDNNHRAEYLSWRLWSVKNANTNIKTISKYTIEEKDCKDQDYYDEQLLPLKLPRNDSLQHIDDPEDDVLSTISADLGSICDDRFPKLYLVLISMHGLIRGNDMELGRDSDTGGQVKYVVELAKALASHPAIHRVDLLTRLIEDPSVDASYSVLEEPITQSHDKYGGAYISRLPCGPTDKYIHKEELWPYIREFADNAVKFIKKKLDDMFHSNEICELYVIHGHYADAGEAATIIADVLGVDVVFTGHSLGRNKLEHLMSSNIMSRVEIEKQYKITRRIEAEERVLDNASIIFTSTEQEIYDQWGMYNGICLDDEAQKSYQHFSKMITLPPGIDFAKFKLDKLNEPPSLWSGITKFLNNPYKPIILAMCRPDKRKNIEKLITVYGENVLLQKIANLVLVLGNRDNINDMANGSKTVLENVLKLVDKYNLYGLVAYPKYHTQDDITDIYLLAHHTKGVFVNIAVQECFGLTLIEAAAHGIPVVATQNGGPVDIIKTLEHGILVDPTNNKQINDSILHILTNTDVWLKFSENGRNNADAYSWKAHRSTYLEIIDEMKRKSVKERNKLRINSCMDDMFMLVNKEIGLSTSVLPDKEINNIIENYYKSKNTMNSVKKEYYVYVIDDKKDNGLLFKDSKLWAQHYGIGVVSIYDLTETLEIINKYEIDLPDFLICICGAEIWYLDNKKETYILDKQYNKYVDGFWYKSITSNILASFLKSQNLSQVVKVYSNVSHHRILIFVNKPDINPKPFMSNLKKRFRRNGVRVNIIVHTTGSGISINIIPIKSSRALATRYLVHKHKLDMENITFVAQANIKDNTCIFKSSDMPDLIEGINKNIIYHNPEYTHGFIYSVSDTLRIKMITS
jgi:sucrose-phosphate synthase